MIHSAALTVYAVRHGETEFNRRRLMQGRRIDAPLNALGERQAHALADRFASIELSSIWVSPLLRARQTADAVARRHPDVPVRQEALLAEMSWGELEGRSIDEAAPLLRRFADEWKAGRFEASVAGGESILDVEARARAVIDRLADEGPGSAVLLVTHGRFMRVLLATATGEGLRTMDRFRHDNTGVYRIVRNAVGTRIDLSNCVAHLEPMETAA